MSVLMVLVATLLVDRCDHPPGRPVPARVARAVAGTLTLARGGGAIIIIPPVVRTRQWTDFWLVARDGRVQVPLRAAGHQRYAYPPLPAASAWKVAEDVTDFLDRPPECRRRARLTIAEALVSTARP
jgi:hypothetical protein